MKKWMGLSLLLPLLLTAAEDLKGKISVLMPLDQSLVVLKGDGSAGSGAVFKRASVAVTPDFRKVESDTPRFVGNGLLIENGYGHPAGHDRGTKNYLPPQLASLDSAEGLPVEGKAETVPGLEGKGALKLDGTLKIDVKYPFGGKFIFSFYLKNGEVKVFDGEKALSSFKADGEWKRCHVMLDAGKEPGQTVLKLTAGTAELDAMMLEGVQNYYHNRQTPSTWLPGDTPRASELLMVALPENFAKAGAISMKFRATSLGGWNCLTSTKGWKAELSMDIRGGGTQIDADLWGKRILGRNHRLELGKEYTLLLTWNDEKGEYYLNGVKMGEMALPSVAERTLPQTICVGGTPDQASPNVRAEGIIRDYALWNQYLTPADVAAITAAPALKELLPASQVLNLVPVNAFGREDGAVTLAWNVKKK